MTDHKPLTVFQLALLGNRNPAAAAEIRGLRETVKTFQETTIVVTQSLAKAEADNAKLRAELRGYEVRDTRLDAIRKDVEAVFGTEANDG